MKISCHISKIKPLCYSYADAESGRIMEVRQQNGGTTVTSYTTLFLVKDHLGSVRAVTDSYGHILERNSYYPFGLQTNQGESYPTISGTLTALYPNILSATQTKRDLYNGKEIQTVAGTDYLDYGFRQYDPVTARWMAVDSKAEKYHPVTPFNFCSGNPISFIDPHGDTLNVLSKKGAFLFSLNDNSDTTTSISTAELYSKGIQWFAPNSDNYMELISINKNLTINDDLKHFSWNDIVSFGEVDRWLSSYLTKGSGDWKGENGPAKGFILVTVDGYPYWSDAIGQIPYSLNTYRYLLSISGDYQFAKQKTIEYGKRFGDGRIFGKSDFSNSYDNAMIEKAVTWASHRYYRADRTAWFSNRFPIHINKNYSPLLLGHFK